MNKNNNGRVGSNALQSFFFAKLPWLCLGLCWPRERESFVLEGLVSVLAAKQPKIRIFFYYYYYYFTLTLYNP